MALRDAAGLLNGLKRVTVALYAEGASELQHALSNSPLQPLTSSLCKTAVKSASGLGWTGEGGYSRLRGLRDDFPEWTGFEEGFPSSESFLGSFKHNGRNFPPPTDHNTEPSEAALTLPQARDTPPPSPPKWPSSGPPPLGHRPGSGPGWSGRQYHTLAQPCLACCHAHRRWFHSSTRYRSDTVVGDGAARSVEASKSKSSKPKQKVHLHVCDYTCINQPYGSKVEFSE